MLVVWTCYLAKIVANFVTQITVRGTKQVIKIFWTKKLPRFRETTHSAAFVMVRVI